ncbi:MAG TPA: hypothetical protein PKC03_17835, partial [Dokdonella sp.]|nr:hypothetical protein [Dokdonella sp.]
FGRIGARPFNLEEMRRLFLRADGSPWYVSNDADDHGTAQAGSSDSLPERGKGNGPATSPAPLH